MASKRRSFLLRPPWWDVSLVVSASPCDELVQLTDRMDFGRRCRMYNIIRYEPGGKSGNQLPNANIISEEYGYSTELITQTSIKCQQKHGGFSFNPYTNG